MNKLKHMVLNCVGNYRRYRHNKHWIEELKEIEKKAEVPLINLTCEQKQEIKDCYAKFGFNVRTDWHRYILSTTGKWSTKMVPENFYHLILEEIYNDSRMNAMEDKNYMSTLLPDVLFPTTLVGNINGYFTDSNRSIISKEEAINIINKEGQAIIKPTRGSGGGREVSLVSTENAEQLFRKLGKNFIVQRIIKQHSETAAFNPSSVNTEKIISFLFNGEVYILSPMLRVGSAGSLTDNAHDGKGYLIGIHEDGTLEDYGINAFGKKRTVDFYNAPFSGRRLNHHKDICDVIKRAHKMLPYFGFLSWDFCVNEDGIPVLIEYNVNYAQTLVFQMTSGPLLGNIFDDVLKDAKKRCDSIKHIAGQ